VREYETLRADLLLDQEEVGFCCFGIGEVMGDKAYLQPIRYLKKYVPLDSLDALDKAERG
jgi:hypothetical protein